VKASPVAKRMARELGLELSDVEGSGPGGRIVKADVEAAAERGGTKTEEAADEPEEPEEPAAEEEQEEAEEKEAAPAKATGGDGGTAKGEVTTEDLTRLQQTVARRMAESKATAPEFVMTVEVEMDAAVELRGQIKAAAAEDEPVPSFNDLVVKACALALRDFPRANGAYRDGKFELYSRVNVGVAVAGMDALVVPTVFDADRKSLGTIAREAKALAEKVREGKISPPELAGGTFTVSNLGMFGIRRFVAVINPPQAAILAVGEMRPTPVVRGGKVTVRSVMEITLSCDHRILYGADAAAFLAKIGERLERPYSLTL
jgi:pyruvate dehydrogenase E2 component (dihydrolipoamide acetyltransferase)